MRVLIAIDSSECSDFAFDSVIGRSWPKDAEFRIITVMEPVYMEAPFGGVYAQPMMQAQVEFEKYCRELIDKKVAQVKQAFPNSNVSGDSLLGVVSPSIIDEAKNWHADLIILGSHGRRGVHRFLLGSVAERVASHSPCSVEIVKQKPHSEKTKQTEAQEVASVGSKV